jgi:hypothetical protein
LRHLIAGLVIVSGDGARESPSTPFVNRPNTRNRQRLGKLGKHGAERFHERFTRIGLAERARLVVFARPTCGKGGSEKRYAVWLFHRESHGEIDRVGTNRRVGAVKVKPIDRHPGDDVVLPWRDAPANAQKLDGNKMWAQSPGECVGQSFERP